MVNVSADLEDLNLETGHLCLDFANTCVWHASDSPEEHLTSYVDLVAWAKQVGLLNQASAQKLLQRATHNTEQADAVLAQAIRLREAIYGIFSAAAGERQSQTEDIMTLNDILRRALGQLRINQTETGFIWVSEQIEDSLARMLGPIARSAAELLTSADLSRVGECADDRGCGYLFFDTSRNRSRRWCDMKGCGNRAKVRDHYRRQLNDDAA